MKIQRLPSSGVAMMVPALAERSGFVVVDATWGTIQPLHVAPGVETVGELDVISHVERGLPLVDTRHHEQRAQATIAGSVGMPHEEIVARIDELDPSVETILFCNGPQCAATPQAVAALLESGYPARALHYYRGGIHDWMTLGLPIEGSRGPGPDT